MKKLPIVSCLEKLKSTLRQNSAAVLSAAPGAGKSTLVPLELLQENWLRQNRILMLQPRRIAALAVARRMSFLSHTPPGGLIGHQVRFNRQISAETRIEVLTEGILTRRIQNDPFLEGVGLIIFDEFHERSIHSDLCLALCREIQKDVRPDLKILVMSATIDDDQLAKYLDNAATINSEGFLFPVEIIHRPVEIEKNRFRPMIDACRRIIADSDPHESYLIFLPGAGEIAMFAQELGETCHAHEILQLHGSLPLAAQQKVLTPDETPRIILATNIAETSLTIEGITTVIDSGYCRTLDYNDATGLESLELRHISKASADQRAGRAGRLRPGRAFRLWSRQEHNALADYDPPEILRADLCSTVLELASWGVRNPHNFSWLTAPPPEKIEAAREILHLLGAIDTEGGITDSGKRMLQLPLHPRLARMMDLAARDGIADYAAAAAAVIAEKDFFKPTRADTALSADLVTRINTLLRNEFGGSADNIDHQALARARKVSQQLLELVRPQNYRPVPDKIRLLQKALLAAFPDRLCRKRNDRFSFKICSGQGFKLPCGCDSSYLIALNLDAGLRLADNDGRIFLFAEIEEETLLEVLQSHLQNSREIFFSEKRKSVLVRHITRYDQLVFFEREDALKPREREMAEKILVGHAFANFNQAFNLNNDETKQFINRLNLIVKYLPEKEFAALDAAWFKDNIETLCAGSVSFAELQKISLPTAYFSGKPYNFKKTFEELVPDSIEVPSGSRIKIEYPDSGEPFVPVKIQEVFGMQETPCICAGRVKLILHLLSPARRPVQITKDLKSFWETGYKTVVAELKGRYPKHPWPDDPARGVAFAGTKKQLERKISRS